MKLLLVVISALSAISMVRTDDSEVVIILACTFNERANRCNEAIEKVSMKLTQDEFSRSIISHTSLAGVSATFRGSCANAIEKVKTIPYCSPECSVVECELPVDDFGDE